MASTFIKSSEDFLTKIDLEIERLQKLRSDVAAAVESEEAIQIAPKGKVEGKRSDEARERMAAAQKARWAKKKAADKKASRTQAATAAAKKISTKKTPAKAAVDA